MVRRYASCVVVLLVAIVAMATTACSAEQTSREGEQGEKQRPAGENRASGPETTAGGDDESAAAGVGEIVEVGDLSVRVFGVRSVDTAYYLSEPGASPGSEESSSGEGYAAVDYVVENVSDSARTLRAEATLHDAQDDPYAPDPSIDAPGATFDGMEVQRGGKRASTAYFDVPAGRTPERLMLASSGGEEAEIDLTDDERGEVPPDDYLYAYHHYLTNNYFEDAYRMLLDPEEERGVSLGDWLTFYEPLWGERYISVDDLTPVSVSSGEAAFFMERTFYGTDGTRIPDEEVNADTEQGLVREGEEWRILMREDLARDVLVSSGSSTEAEDGASVDEEQYRSDENGSGSSRATSDDDELADLGEVVTVSRVVDGDTVEVSPAVDGVSDVRLIGVDTPETHGGTEPYGEEASAFTEERLEGEEVVLELDVETTDRYGRLLAYAWLPDGSMFNETLLSEGYAQVATFPPNVKYVDRFLAAQERARAGGRGLWGLPEEELCELANRGNGIGGGCEGGQAPEATPTPSASAGGGSAAPISENECPASDPIKGNHSSSGELIYHAPGGQFYDVTNPEECFASPEDAEAAGYRASQR